MTFVELKSEIHGRIEQLTEEQLKRLQAIVDQEFKDKDTQRHQPKHRDLFGSMKGVVTYMADDFNEPLDDFEDYMPGQHPGE